MPPTTTTTSTNHPPTARPSPPLAGHVHAILAAVAGEAGSVRRHPHRNRQGGAAGQLSHTNLSDMESQFGRKLRIAFQGVGMFICVWV